MRIIKISEALTRVGEQITGVSGVLKSVYKVKNGEGQYGKWSLQDALIEDDSGSMQVTFANLGDMMRFRGQKVTMTAKEGKKGISGLQVKKNEYEGKTYIKLHVSGSALIDAGVSHEVGPELEAYSTTHTSVPHDADPEERAALELLARKKAEKLASEALEKAKAQGQSKQLGAQGRIYQIMRTYNQALYGALYMAKKHDIDYCHEMTATLFIAMRDDGVTEFQPSTMLQPDNSAQLINPDPVVQPDPVEEVDQEQPDCWQEVKLHIECPHKGELLGDLEDEVLEELFSTFRPVIDIKTKTYSQRDVVLMGALKSWKAEAL